MKSIQIIFIAFLAITLFSACNKKDNEIATATITFAEPLANDTIAFGEELHAEGTITGTGKKHGYTLSIQNQTTGTSVFSSSSHSHATSYAFHEHWVNDVAQISTVQVSLVVDLGHDGQKVTKTVAVTCLPY